MDKAGRVVLPKPVRDHLRLRPGSNFELEERAEGIFDWNRVVEDHREERIKDLSGL